MPGLPRAAQPCATGRGSRSTIARNAAACGSIAASSTRSSNAAPRKAAAPQPAPVQPPPQGGWSGGHDRGDAHGHGGHYKKRKSWLEDIFD